MPGRRGSPTDPSDAGWGPVEPSIPPGRPALHPRREIDAGALGAGGVRVRLPPHDLPLGRWWTTTGAAGGSRVAVAALRGRRRQGQPTLRGGTWRRRGREGPPMPPADRHRQIVPEALVTAAEVGDGEGLGS